jgi:hypothetical protein
MSGIGIHGVPVTVALSDVLTVTVSGRMADERMSLCGRSVPRSGGVAGFVSRRADRRWQCWRARCGW